MLKTKQNELWLADWSLEMTETDIIIPPDTQDNGI